MKKSTRPLSSVVKPLVVVLFLELAFFVSGLELQLLQERFRVPRP